MKIGEMVLIGKNKKGTYLGSEMTPFGLYHRVELPDGTNIFTGYCRPTKHEADLLYGLRHGCNLPYKSTKAHKMNVPKKLIA